jgi:glycosyltransferase involved in cell wall biosynthesis
VRVAILGIKTYPAMAGADRVVEKLIENRLPRNEYFLYLSRIDNNEVLPCRGNLHFVYVPSVRGKHLGAFVYFLLSSLHVLFKGSCHIAHVHNSDFGLLNIVLRAKRGLKIIGTFHGNPYMRKKWSRIAKFYLKISEYFFVKLSDRLTTVSMPKIAEIPIRHRHKVTYIPNGIDLQATNETEDGFDYAGLGLRKREYLLFACGRLDETKGLHHLIKAFKNLAVNGLKLLVIGDFTHDHKYAARIEAMSKDFAGVVLFKSILPKARLFDVLRNCRLFIFPSEVEGMSMLLLETISLKVPVVCSDIAENRQVVGNEYKYLFASGNALSLSEKIRAALADPALPEQCIDLCRKVASGFDWRTIAARYEQLYREVYKG